MTPLSARVLSAAFQTGTLREPTMKANAAVKSGWEYHMAWINSLCVFVAVFRPVLMGQ
jgi:hypothetical protein